MMAEFIDTWPDSDKKIKEAESILLSKDQDEIDFYLFRFWSEERFNYK
jgi:hypothetical protein